MTFSYRGCGALKGTVTLMDLSPERLVTKPSRSLRLLRAEEDMVYNQLRASGGGLVLLRAESSFETRDILAEGAQLMGLFDLAGLLAQTEVEKLFAAIANLRLDFVRSELANFFKFHRCIQLAVTIRSL